MKQLLGSILGGSFMTSMTFMHLNDVFQKKFGFSVDLGFSELGSISESIGLIVLLFISALFGAMVAGYMAKKRYVLVGILSASVYFLLIVILMGLLFFVTTGSTMNEIDSSIFGSSVMVNFYIYFGLSILSIFGGGVLGGILSKLLFDKYIYSYNVIPIHDNAYLNDYLQFYFARKWRSFFTIIVFTWGFSCFIYNLPNIITYLKWHLIGPWFALFHPILWWPVLIWFVFLPIGTFIFFLLPIAMFFPLACLHWIYKIGISGRTLLKKTIFIMLLFLSMGIISHFLSAIGQIPIYYAVSAVSNRGSYVWGILLDKYTRPIAHENRYKYFSENNKDEKAPEELFKAINLYYDLGMNQLRSKNLTMANEAFDKVAQLSKNDIDWEKLIASAYFDYEVYGKAKEELESLYEVYPEDLEIMYYLSSTYMELYEEEKALPIVKKAYEIRKNEMTEDEKREFFEGMQKLEKDIEEGER